MKSFWAGLQFLTRLRIVKKDDWTEEDFGGSVKYFPFYGAIIGIILLAGYYVFNLFFPPLLTAAAILILEVYVTGGIQLDGFMDTMDGLYSGREPTQILEIMRDSRVGAHSVMALGLLYLVKFSIYYEFPRELLLPALGVMPALGRWAMVIGITQFAYARPAGMGKCFREFSGRNAIYVATLLAAAAAAVLGWLGAVVFCAVGAQSYLFCRRVSLKLGGLTGDVYGAAAELAQVVALLVFYLSSMWTWPLLL